MLLWSELFALVAQAEGSHYKFVSIIATLSANHLVRCKEVGLRLGAGTRQGGS